VFTRLHQVEGLAEMELGCMMMARSETPDHVATAERLGYDFVLVADSPAFMADPWMTLARAADRTTRIRLGPAAITPRMRHVVANAGAAALLSQIAPGRSEVVVGSGFTSQAMIGKKPVPWSEVEEYIVALRSLLAGEETAWDGSVTALTYGPLVGITLPVDLPILVAAHGPKGYAVAERVGDGIVTNPMHGNSNELERHRRIVVQVNGTVLEDDESFDDPRVFATAGPAAAMQLHLGEGGAARGTLELAAFTAALEEIDASRRHLQVHRSHFIAVTDFEREFVTPDLIRRCTDTGTRDQWRTRISGFDAQGVTGVMLAPAGTDITRELAAFAECVKR
jgi:5,10-methylenetetrahydromethanopterin reductase